MGSVCGSWTPSVSRLDQASTAAASKPPFPALQRCTRRTLPRNTRPGVRLRATQRAGRPAENDVISGLPGPLPSTPRRGEITHKQQ